MNTCRRVTQLGMIVLTCAVFGSNVQAMGMPRVGLPKKAPSAPVVRMNYSPSLYTPKAISFLKPMQPSRLFSLFTGLKKLSPIQGLNSKQLGATWQQRPMSFFGKFWGNAARMIKRVEAPSQKQEDFLNQAIKALSLDNAPQLQGSDKLFKDKLQFTFLTSIKLGNVDYVKGCIEAGADVNRQIGGEYSPLHLAIKEAPSLIFTNEDRRRGDRLVEIIDVLLDSGANIESHGEYKQTPLFYAAQRNKNSVVKKLLDRGARAHTMDKFGDSALRAAIGSGEEAEETVELLLAHGARESINKNSDKYSVMKQAMSSGSAKTVKLLHDYATEEQRREFYTI
ncbi:MAG: ankyrin repeat domain-containing protein [Epsilonproteobacteria bacterium]|nr:ankyrin repeat domain-containing protein [Campylobacterota bacterium]